MRYEAPESMESAIGLLAAEPGMARILMGGTDLLVQLRAGLIEPDLIVDVKRIDDLHRIEQEAGGFRIGAAVTGAEIGEHPQLRKMWPGVVEAAELIGSTQVQGRCTMAGNLCNASPAADSVPALVAADARLTIAGPAGRREIPVLELPVGPGSTCLARDEILESIYLPSRPESSADAYLRFIPRTEMDIAVVGAGVSLSLDPAGVCVAARVALGAVAATVLLVEEAGAALVGSAGDEAALERLAQAASAACRPIDDKRGTIEFRTKVAGVMAQRAATIAFQRAGGSV